jgi:hypothetical protein
MVVSFFIGERENPDTFIWVETADLLHVNRMQRNIYGVSRLVQGGIICILTPATTNTKIMLIVISHVN